MFNFKLIDKQLNLNNKDVMGYIVSPHSYFEALTNYGSSSKLIQKGRRGRKAYLKFGAIIFDLQKNDWHICFSIIKGLLIQFVISPESLQH